MFAETDDNAVNKLLRRPMLNSLLESVYPLPGEEEEGDQGRDAWQPEVQKLCMDLLQLLTRFEPIQLIIKAVFLQKCRTLSGWRMF